MAAAANYAWVNRSSMTFLVRQAFSKVWRAAIFSALFPFLKPRKVFGQTPDDMDMNVVYDVSHNIAKVRPAAELAETQMLCVQCLFLWSVFCTWLFPSAIFIVC